MQTTTVRAASHHANDMHSLNVGSLKPKGAFTSNIKHAIKLKTSPARLVELLQPSLAFCFSLQPMT